MILILIVCSKFNLEHIFVEYSLEAIYVIEVCLGFCCIIKM